MIALGGSGTLCFLPPPPGHSPHLDHVRRLIENLQRKGGQGGLPACRLPPFGRAGAPSYVPKNISGLSCIPWFTIQAAPEYNQGSDRQVPLPQAVVPFRDEHLEACPISVIARFPDGDLCDRQDLTDQEQAKAGVPAETLGKNLGFIL